MQRNVHVDTHVHPHVHTYARMQMHIHPSTRANTHTVSREMCTQPHTRTHPHTCAPPAGGGAMLVGGVCFRGVAT